MSPRNFLNVRSLLETRPVKLAVLISVLAWAACDATSPLAPSMESASPSDSAELSAHDAPIAQKKATIRVLCFGDSFTYGTTQRAVSGFAALSSVEGYVPKLERLLKGADNKFVLINAGIGGETTSAGLERLPTELRLHDPDLVLLWLGVVDINTNDKARFTLLRDNLVAMMQRIEASGAKVIIGTFPAMDPDGFRALAPENVPRLNDAIRQEANGQQVPIAGHERAFGGDLALIGPDGLHPNDSGYQIIAETWFAAIEELRLP